MGQEEKYSKFIRYVSVQRFHVAIILENLMGVWAHGLLRGNDIERLAKTQI